MKSRNRDESQANLTSLLKHFVPETEKRANMRSRLPLSSTTLYPILLRKMQRLERYRQLALLDESAFASWARDRGVEVSGIIAETDIDVFWRKGWLRADNVELVSRSWKRRHLLEPEPYQDSMPVGVSRPTTGRWLCYEYKLHPFRIYPTMKVLDTMRWALTRSSVLYGAGVKRYADRHVNQVQRVLKVLAGSKRLTAGTESLTW